MVNALAILLLCQLIGETLSRALALPVPGPVIGMALLFLALLWRGGPDEDLRQTSQGILQHLSLLFIPAGTGIILHLHRIGDEWLPLFLSLVLSTALALAVTALVMKLCQKTQDKESV